MKKKYCYYLCSLFSACPCILAGGMYGRVPFFPFGKDRNEGLYVGRGSGVFPQ